MRSQPEGQMTTDELIAALRLRCGRLVLGLDVQLDLYEGRVELPPERLDRRLSCRLPWRTGMSDQPEGQMTTDELIAALRKDAAGFGSERHAAQAEINRLEAARKAALLPDAEIRAGLRGVREKLEGLWNKVRLGGMAPSLKPCAR